MNLIDLLLVFVILLGAWGGWQKGAVLELINLLILAGSLLTAFFLYPHLAVLCKRYIHSLGIWTMPVSFLVSLILARMVIAALLKEVLKVVPNEVQYYSINAWLGIFPGLAAGLINATIIAAILLSIPLADSLSASTRESKLADRLTVPAEWMEAKLSPVFDEAVKQTMNKLTLEPGSNETIHLPFKDTHPKVREDLEIKMLGMLNKEREKQGLPLLLPDTQLTRVARSHSMDMFAKGYFAHTDPEGNDPFDRMRAAGVHFLAAGENLALAQTLGIAHNGLMNSPGHRANILRSTFGHVGIGILDGGFYGLMVSQEFKN